MSGRSHPQISNPHRGATGRFRLALAASAVAHLLFAVGVVTEPFLRKERFHDRAPVVAILEILPPVPVFTAAEDGEKRLALPLPHNKSVETWGERRTAAPAALQQRVPDTTRIVLPEVPDTTVYTAADLDSYPRPIVPLELGRVSGWSGQLRLELFIDEHGNVVRVTFPEPVAPGAPEAALRELIAGARFAPARKEGRAVKSRIVLSVNSAAR